LYGCETWSLTLREEHTLRVFENRVLRGIVGPKESNKYMDKIGKFTIFPLHQILFLDDKVRKEKNGRGMGDTRNAYRILVRKPARKRWRGFLFPTERPVRLPNQWVDGAVFCGAKPRSHSRLAQGISTPALHHNAAFCLSTAATSPSRLSQYQHSISKLSPDCLQNEYCRQVKEDQKFLKPVSQNL
jgi:hypothetical protein